MSDDDPPPPRRKPIPLFLWAVIGFLLVLGFMFAMRALNPTSLGTRVPAPDIALPAAAKPAPLPDARPIS
ncbi:hypothetical protein GGQ61_000108 [Phenylobacterium haematophilum]|uniref:Uncharacterized protein n=1 Tax=Phenylobacterium haematophilum TaxID=98513 RepID=A0A839ZVJ9_9CAUL|nr:hypothetical protein [Phenylobacterium haematophilum]MBB3889411.1 hypothetical protein [Phenylobacterium haematophilum]